jgi:hypothetical protein
MDLQTSPEILNAFWGALNEKSKFLDPKKPRKTFDKIYEQGWVTLSDVEDVFYLLDPRLDHRNLSVESLCELFQISVETIYFKPSPKSNEVMGFSAIRYECLISLLINLERFGFETDASILVSKIRPLLKVKSKKVLSTSELDVFWFDKLQHKSSPVSLFISDLFDHQYNEKNFATYGGYKIHAKIDLNGNVIRIEVKSPKFRRRAEPRNVTCKECGVKWRKGDPDSSAMHRREHKRRMSYFDPKPVSFLLELKTTDKDFELVTSLSPRWKHKEIYERALAFKKEFRYDFVQWQSPKGDSDPDVQGFLFSNSGGAIVGACSFRKRSMDGKKRWALDWVWICPKERRQGHLANRWGFFRERFGDFTVEPPVSEAMMGFLNKKGEKAY